MLKKPFRIHIWGKGESRMKKRELLDQGICWWGNKYETVISLKKKIFKETKFFFSCSTMKVWNNRYSVTHKLSHKIIALHVGKVW